MLCNCDLWLCCSAVAVKSQRHTARCLYSADKGANGVDKPRFRVGWVWWRSGQWVKCVTSATFMLVMGFKQAVTSHLEEGIFFPNDVIFFFWCEWTCDGSAWFRDCILIVSYPKQGRWQTPNPTYWTCFFMGRERTRGMTLWWPWSFGDNFSIPLHRLTSSPQNPECNRQLINEGLSV